MMRSFGLSVAAIGWAAAAGALAAQDPRCSTLDVTATRACNTGIDGARAFHPLAGLIVSGGTPLLGGAGSIGGLGHFAAAARLNAVKISLPDPDSAGQTSVPSSYVGLAPAPVLEAGIGLFHGKGASRVAVDGLGSALLLPTGVVSGLSAVGGLHVGSVVLGLGYGIRVGALSGTFPVPSLSVSVMRRTVPRIRYGRLAPVCCGGDLFEFDTDLRATNVRVVGGFSFARLDVAAGVGFDHYASSARIRFYDTPPANRVRIISLDLANSRRLVFVDAGVSLTLVKLVLELGVQTGKDQQLSTDFTDFDPTSGHAFGSLGLRFGF